MALPETNAPRSNAPRLFIEPALGNGVTVECTREQANYLLNVMRLARSDDVIVFNGRDGEWRTVIAEAGKRRCTLLCEQQTRPQLQAPDLHYLFAPLKHARLDYMVQKATEMGASRLRPVLTRRTVATRVNSERMRANAIEAAEQCNILWVPEVDEPQRLGAVLQDWDARRRLIFCDEAADVADPLAALSELAPGPLAVIVGPEGGFDAEERAQLAAAPFARAISLGPRIMRADTAAVAALALINAALGDWR
jgi:16S rRNA (uracil1498-N3)-methyltransferase